MRKRRSNRRWVLRLGLIGLGLSLGLIALLAGSVLLDSGGDPLDGVDAGSDVVLASQDCFTVLKGVQGSKVLSGWEKAGILSGGAGQGGVDEKILRLVFHPSDLEHFVLRSFLSCRACVLRDEGEFSLALAPSGVYQAGLRILSGLSRTPLHPSSISWHPLGQCQGLQVKAGSKNLYIGRRGSVWVLSPSDRTAEERLKKVDVKNAKPRDWKGLLSLECGPGVLARSKALRSLDRISLVVKSREWDLGLTFKESYQKRAKAIIGPGTHPMPAPRSDELFAVDGSVDLQLLLDFMERSVGESGVLDRWVSGAMGEEEWKSLRTSLGGHLDAAIFARKQEPSGLSPLWSASVALKEDHEVDRILQTCLRKVQELSPMPFTVSSQGDLLVAQPFSPGPYEAYAFKIGPTFASVGTRLERIELASAHDILNTPHFLEMRVHPGQVAREIQKALARFPVQKEALQTHVGDVDRFMASCEDIPGLAGQAIKKDHGLEIVFSPLSPGPQSPLPGQKD